MPSNKNKRKAFSNILLLAATLVIFLILAEGIVRLSGIASKYGPVKGLFQKDDLLDYSMTPNFKGEFEKEEFSGINISTNSLRLRDIEYGDKKPDEYRILALGDSFTWGAYGTELNQTFIKLLEAKLNKNPNKLNYKIINSGVPGYGTDQELLYLENKGIKLEPDLVLVNFFVGNDFHDNAQTGELTVRNGYLFTNKLEETILQKSRNFLVLHSHLYRILEKGMASVFGTFLHSSVKNSQYSTYESKLFIKADNEIKNEFENTEKILTNLNSYAKQNNLKLAIAIIPLDYQVDESQKQAFIRNNFNANEKYDMQQPQNVIKEWAKKNNVFVIDLLPELSKINNNGDLYWKLSAHFNVKGNEAAAEILYNNLLDNKKLITKK